uniref:Uncharacterized protein n=1 Tax=Arundo donax TaxID=35708 RepID=A0A0A8YDB3_ARUDO
MLESQVVTTILLPSRASLNSILNSSSISLDESHTSSITMRNFLSFRSSARILLIVPIGLL